jgi:hypothetical protein
MNKDIVPPQTETEAKEEEHYRWCNTCGGYADWSCYDFDHSVIIKTKKDDKDI